MKRWYEFKNATTERTELWIYEEIGETFWGEGLTAKQFVRDLAALDTEAIDLHVNSPGGNVFDGQAIYTALRSHRATVTTYIDGLAASIASVIALAGDTVVMASNALFMIHDPYGFAMGTAADMRKMGDTLDKVAETIIGVYAAKTGKSSDDLAAAMAEETWLSAEEAVEWGFADEVSGAVKAAAMADLSRFPFRHAPTALHRHTTDGSAEGPTVAQAAEAIAQPRARVFVPGIGFRNSIPRGGSPCR